MSGEDVREVMEALSERTRYSILEALSKKPMTGDEIAEAVQRSRSTVESHLSTLLRLGLVSRRREDKKYYYEATGTARTWLGKVSTSNAARTTVSPPERPTTKGRSLYFSWLFAPILLGIVYSVANTLAPVPIWIFALVYGGISVLFCATLMELIESLLIASIVVSAVPALFKAFSVVELGLSFIISLAFLLVFGIPIWWLIKKARRS